MINSIKGFVTAYLTGQPRRAVALPRGDALLGESRCTEGAPRPGTGVVLCLGLTSARSSRGLQCYP